MRIDSVAVDHIAMPRIHRTVTAAPGRHIAGSGEPATISHFFVVRLVTDTGIVGIGEVSDFEEELGLPHRADLQKTLSDLLVGEDPIDIERIMGKVHFPRAIIDCAVDNALFDIKGKSMGVSVADLLGGRVRDSIPVSWVVYLRDSELVTAEMTEMIEAHGFTDFKLKVGLDIDHDERCVREIRRIAGPDATIKLDAQGNWGRDEAIANIARLAPYQLLGVESPVLGRGVEDLAYVRNAVDVPIIEHVDRDIARARELIRAGSVDVFNVATCWAGGIMRATELVSLAADGGLGVLMGSTVELGIGTAAQALVAGTSQAVALPSDLVGPALYVDDVISTRFSFSEGSLPVPTGIGLGVELDEAKIASYRWQEQEG